MQPAGAAYGSSMSNPLSLGKLQLRSRVLVAPMSGVTDLPFRRVLQDFAPGLVVSEMVASDRLAKGDPENIAKAAGGGEIYPLAIQLVGRDPALMAQAAKTVEAAGADLIDINFGCPARKVVNGMSGSALMREPELALCIVAAVVEAVAVPVTVKMRLGWDEASLNAPDIAAQSIARGAVGITVHGRTRCQFYKGDADWAAVRATVDAVGAPVFVNGDIGRGEQALDAMTLSGADGVMVGRSLIGRPWDIVEIMNAVDGVDNSVMSPEAKADCAVAHYRDILEFYPEGKGIRFARKHLAGYCDAAGLSTDDPLRSEICRGLEPHRVAEALAAAFTFQALAA